jgi:short-subunit dehydrogenase
MKRTIGSGTTVLLTGASSGIGRSLALDLAARGASLILTARRVDRLEAIQQQLDPSGKRVAILAGDLTDPVHRTRLIDACRERFAGRLDALINNAGIGAIGPFEAATERRLRSIFELNFFATTEITRGILPLLHRGNRSVICSVGSVLAHVAVANKSEYCASKFALRGWSDSLRLELKGTGIDVVVVHPSTTRSEFFDSVIDSPDGLKSDSIGSMSCEAVAHQVIAAIERGKAERVLSAGGKALVWSGRMVPAPLRWILSRRQRS